MSTKYDRPMRYRLYAVVAVVMLGVAVLFYWHGMYEHGHVHFHLIDVVVILLLIALSVLFVRQFQCVSKTNRYLMAQQQELKLKAEMIDSVSDAILLLDEKGGLVQFNDALCRITGYSRQFLQSARIQDFMSAENGSLVEERIQKVFDDGEALFETIYLHSSGRMVPVEGKVRSVEIGRRRLVLSVVNDISDRSVFEQKLKTVATEWRDTFDAIEDSVWLLDMERHIIRANRASHHVFGISPKEALGMHCCQATYGKVLPRRDCPFEVVLATGKRASAQFKMKGMWYEASVDPILDEQGNIFRVAYIVKNINELKKAEQREQLRSAILEQIAGSEPLQQQLSFIVHSIEKENPGMLCSVMLVSDDGKYLLNGAAPSLPDSYNRATDRIKIGEGIGSCGTAAFRLERVIVEDIDNDPLWKNFAPAQEAGLRSCWSEPIVSSSGLLLGTFAIYQRTPALPAADEISLIQQASAFAGIAIERSRGDAERMKLEQLLGQAQKMEAIGHLAGGIAHDFNNLLTPILIYADMLKRSVPDNEKARLQLDGITKASGKARDLTQQLLSFGRKQVMDMQVVDLNEIIMAFYSIVRRTLRENINLTLQLSSKPIVVRVDSSKMEQVLLNLVLNAQDAIEAGGTISMKTGHVLIDNEFARWHHDMPAGRFVLLEVIDDGCGMSAETLAQIFEPFFSTKDAGHGTGLGLANVYGIVKQHNSHITAVSTVGRGTVFKIFIPVCDEKASDAAPEVKPDVDIDHTGCAVILLVEDNEMVRVMSHDLLEGFGYTVYSSGHPERALELLEEIPEKVDLVITDVVMPGMNGQQLYERIAAEHPEIDKVLYMSGYTNNVIVNEGELEEGIHFLQKPFTVDALMDKVSEILHSEG